MASSPPYYDGPTAAESSKTKSLWGRFLHRVKVFNKARMDYVRLAWPTEWAVFKKGAWWGILFFIITLLIHNWVHNCVYMLAGQYGVYGPYGRPGNPVVDLLFELFGPGPAEWNPAPGDIILYFTILMGVGYALRPLLFPFPYRAMNILWRWAMVASLATYARLASFIFTILPGPADHCSEANFDPPTTASEIFARIFVSGGCSDLIFSGHMLYVITVTCALFRYAQNWFIKYFALVLNILQGILIIASRRHNTVDVVVAAYAVPCIWCTFAYFVPNDFEVEVPPEITGQDTGNSGTDAGTMSECSEPITDLNPSSHTRASGSTTVTDIELGHPVATSTA
ncbi:NF-X1-type zinc finger protein nfxl1 [Perkinsus chesapeaki]|uniref:NF-X1-type zinc finger protein nfxl1 n=1 Tax=Perkinsus chesapeaki TaxID=330153 RepID=A0A7J6MM47_PERCH|nr:NF-X1-type zinc finger protein nfxl1 [Perkinsus chesapeaki]